MRYTLLLTRSAQKDLEALPPEVLRRVDQALEELADNPFPPGKVKKLKGSGHPPVYRLRVGDYRVLFTVDPEAKTLTVARVKHRREAYR
ncbi:type II toxin-antitoxin system RelE family toxin [Thermus tengchongensis]|uniref:Type II toxin-antitoxin system RelE/ParE family toxin n=1 Tax=Thermus tengchongensis TaxID=1214928 RepID=A0A4Y9EVW5_9DEIN|nr:type II toxin-antitoxin system RelE/ParE family toxin [Thermus tengchongensis]TFU14824.1 type II toxin-antitoxin system RelE/ParE family toxin [Thermus tengchongensis]TFU24789.1 type II toxin-antitoxin system RelE/ParE family toxin [Thermus tengchongensis]